MASAGLGHRRGRQHGLRGRPGRLGRRDRLGTLAVSYHQPTTGRSFLARLASCLEPTAEAKGDSGPIRQAQWIGNGFVLVSGSNLDDNGDEVASDPAGLDLIDTRDWTTGVLAPDADSFTVANGVVLVTGARWRGTVNPTGMGLEAYGANGERRFALFPVRAVWVDFVANGRAYIWTSGWKRDHVVDLRSGRVLGVRTAATPLLLLGQGDTRLW